VGLVKVPLDSDVYVFIFIRALAISALASLRLFSFPPPALVFDLSQALLLLLLLEPPHLVHVPVLVFKVVVDLSLHFVHGGHLGCVGLLKCACALRLVFLYCACCVGSGARHGDKASYASGRLLAESSPALPRLMADTGPAAHRTYGTCFGSGSIIKKPFYCVWK
jgi:hypothetical protein